MFPPVVELLLTSQLALVLMHVLFPTEIFPLPPAELPHRTMSAPLVCSVIELATTMFPEALRSNLEEAPEVIRF
jgi:hypothetical protein